MGETFDLDQMGRSLARLADIAFRVAVVIWRLDSIDTSGRDRHRVQPIGLHKEVRLGLAR